MIDRIKLWLGLADGPRAHSPQPTADLRELGVSGTSIFSGYLRDQAEYNADLTGSAAIRVYDQMRLSDAQVAASLMAVKLPIRSAQWPVVAPENATPVEQEASAFVEAELERLDLDAVVSNALLMLDFGCAAHEDVWEIEGGGVHIARLAPRLATTFNRWLVKAGSDELAAIEQQGYRAEQYLTVQVPIEKLALFTFAQEGANYLGRSILRAAYKPWTMKSKLEIVDAIAQERNGLGIPTITMGPSPKREDIALAHAWVQAISTHQSAGIVLPPDWKFEMTGVSGQVRNAHDSIVYHNQQISKAMLVSFLDLGATETGSRAVGDTLSDFFYLSVQAVANHIARVFSQTTIRRLVDFNFPGVEHYPRVQPAEILSLKFETLAAALKELADSSMVEPDDEMEAWLRKKVGAPEKGKARSKPQPQIPPIAPIQPKAEGGSPNAGNPNAGKGGGQPPIAASDALPTAHSLQPTAGLSRPPRGAERFLALADFISRLDQARDQVAAAMREARDRIQAEVLVKLLATPARQLHRASIALDEKLVAEIEDTLRGLAEYGRGQVHEERDRQRAGAEPAGAAESRQMLADTPKPKRPDDPLGVYADAAVSEFTNSVQARGTSVVLDLLRRGGLAKGELLRQADEALDGQSDKWIDAIGSKAANEAFAEGRDEGYAELASQIRECYVSAILDAGTCEACQAADGETGPTPADITPVPNPDCAGGDRCRCVVVYIFADEVPALAYDEDQARDEIGQWAYEGGGTAGGSAARSARATASLKNMTAERRRHADRRQGDVARITGGQVTDDNEPFDVIRGKNAIEVKTLIDQGNDKITMHPESLARKQKDAKKFSHVYTLVVDDRPGSGGKLYLREGLGSFRLGAMQPISRAELKRKLGA